MKTQSIEYQDGGVTLLGYLAYDDKVSGKRPGVLVMPQVCGPGIHSRSKAEKLAKLGYVAFAGDYYGNGRELDKLNDAIKLAHSLFDDTTVLRRRGTAALNKLASLPQVDSSRVASIGFCIGGNFSLELARDGAPLRAVVSFHGGLHTERPAQKGHVKAKILVCTGGDDQLVSLEQVNAFQTEMTAAGVDWQVITYGGVKHNFTDPDAARLDHPALEYHRVADDRSWNAMAAFFKEIFA
jgi:dienelactone hydrolase